MRIRTIKPEFWMHEGLCSKSEFTRLLAIALLNWADDEGYFMANPVLIRGQVFPFLDDSKKIPRSIEELSSVGWIELGVDNEGRSVGRIINFGKHQRVDKPKESTIKGKATFQDASKKNPGGIQDASWEEGKGREEEEKGKDSSCPQSGGLLDGIESGGDKDKHENQEAERFVDWFIELLRETNGVVPSLTKSNRYLWADTYDKLLRIDGKTKEAVKEVCRWARNDTFWQSNFMAPPKLRAKKDGISYFDIFQNKMKTARPSEKQPVLVPLPENAY